MARPVHGQLLVSPQSVGLGTDMITFQQENRFDFLSREYGNMFASSRASAFQSPTWLHAFYSNLAPYQGAEPVVIVARRAGELLGVIPLIRRRLKGLSLVEATDLGVSDYASPVLCDPVRQALQDDTAVADQFIKAIGPCDILRIRPVLPDHESDWRALLRRDPQPLGFSAHAVNLTPPFEEWRKVKLDKSLASMVARKGRRWKKQNEVVLERLRDPARIDLAITELASLRKGRFNGDPIQDEAVQQFYSSVACGGALSGEAETWVVTSDGATAGILFGLTHQGRFLYLLIGADYDSHGRHSPGLQMYDWIMEDWMARAGTCFDFTIGDESFKEKFGTQAVPMSTFLLSGSVKGRLALAMFNKRLMRQDD
jgi:CelD/BcsL family acetyltransferase involved in cellulose biosynthesis